MDAEQRRHRQDDAVAIPDIDAMHDGVDQEALRIDENMPLLALDLLACIVAMRIVGPLLRASSRSGCR